MRTSVGFVYPVEYRTVVDSVAYHKAVQVVTEWLDEMGIAATNRSGWFDGNEFVDCWDLDSTEDQMLFMLKWSGK